MRKQVSTANGTFRRASRVSISISKSAGYPSEPRRSGGRKRLNGRLKSENKAEIRKVVRLPERQKVKGRAVMATATTGHPNKTSAATSPARAAPIPRVLRQRVEPLLEESYAFMDSPIFKQREIGKQLFDMNSEPQLPPVAWYQPTRDEAVEQSMAGAPQLMTAAEERLMF